MTDLPHWYQLRISRAKSLGLQQRAGLHSLPYVGLIATLIGLIWAVAIGIGTTLVVLAMFRKNMPLDRVGPVGFGLIMFGIVLLRSAVYLLIESQFLFALIGERQYFRWANSFNRAEEGQSTGLPDSTHISYQYRPWWLMLVLIASAVALLATGLRFSIMLWATIPGAALLFETLLRFGLEVWWLRTQTGAATKLFLLRWLPWLSIPIRQFQHKDSRRHRWGPEY